MRSGATDRIRDLISRIPLPAAAGAKDLLACRLSVAAGEKFSKDAHHANAAGEYLGALVWYGFLFNESPEKLTFVPSEVGLEFAAHLRKVAWAVVCDTAARRGIEMNK